MADWSDYRKDEDEVEEEEGEELAGLHLFPFTPLNTSS